MSIGLLPPLSLRLAEARRRPIAPHFDPWDPYVTAGWTEGPLLTSIEVSVTNLCNLRCEHCAVGYLLDGKDQREVRVEQIIARLDELDSLLTFSLTGGEPAASERLVDEVLLPLLQYAKGRGLKTQVNTNLTLPLERYRRFVPYVDVLHISYNYTDAADFARVAYAHAAHRPADPTALFRRLDENIAALAAEGVYVSAESILTEATLPKIEQIHDRIVRLGCLRHEIHPLYPSDFAAAMRLPTLDELRDAARRLLKARHPDVWILFGTFPFFACSPDPADREILREALLAPNTTVRNDPDGRCRLNICSLTGDVRIQDFADQGPIGNIARDSLAEVWRRWLDSDTARRILCHCPAAKCLGPNLIVAEHYFPAVDWQQREALTVHPDLTHPPADDRPDLPSGRVG